MTDAPAPRKRGRPRQTRRVRVQMLIDKDGYWAAYGSSEMDESNAHDSLFHLMSEAADVEHSHTVFLTADVPLPTRPKPIEAKAVVSKDHSRNGGIARAAVLSPERRSEIARLGAKTRWAKRCLPAQP